MCCVGSGGWCGLILGKGFLWWSARRHPGVPAWAPLPPARFHLPAQGRRAGVCTPSSPMVSFALTLTRSQRPPPSQPYPPGGSGRDPPPQPPSSNLSSKPKGFPLTCQNPTVGRGRPGVTAPMGRPGHSFRRWRGSRVPEQATEGVVGGGGHRA